MRSGALEALITELAGDAREKVSAHFMPSFHRECGVVLTLGDDGWAGTWVTPLRGTRGDPVLSWLDPATSREAIEAGPGRLQWMADQIRATALAPPLPAGGDGVVLDGCMFLLSVRGETTANREGNVADFCHADVAPLVELLCDLAEELARSDATREAFEELRGYLH